MKNNMKDAIASIMAILRNNNLTELAFGDYDELNDPTYVFWWDNHGTPYEDPVIKIVLEDDDLAIEVEARDFGNIVTLSSSDIDREERWQGIRDNVMEVLQRDGRRRCPACGKVLAGEDESCSDECRRQECRSDLNRYYRENKDEINSSIMELACDLAAARLMNEHGQPFKAFVEPDDPDDPESGTHYKDEFQDEFDRYYDEEYDRIARLMKFDLGMEAGIREETSDESVSLQNAPDNPFVALVQQAHEWQKEARRQIVETLRHRGGRVTFTPEEADGDYPVASLLYGKHDFPRVDLTDVYLEEEEHGTYIMADGIDSVTGKKRTGFQIYDEQLYDIALFLKWVL